MFDVRGRPEEQAILERGLARSTVLWARKRASLVRRTGMSTFTADWHDLTGWNGKTRTVDPPPTDNRWPDPDRPVASQKTFVYCENGRALGLCVHGGRVTLDVRLRDDEGKALSVLGRLLDELKTVFPDE